MRTAVLLTLFFSSCILTEAARKVCVPGEQQLGKCYECNCSQSGSHWDCSEKPCPVPQCLEGTTWKHRCNDCVCKEGKPVCTVRDCSKLPTDARITHPCLFKPLGEKFLDPSGSCNICHCTDLHTSVCDDYDLRCGFRKTFSRSKSIPKPKKSDNNLNRDLNRDSNQDIVRQLERDIE